MSQSLERFEDQEGLKGQESQEKRFEEQGPAGLMDEPRKKREESSIPEVTRRSILMLKESHPEYGCERISDI